MSAGFVAVQWNRAKLVYDGILIACVVAFIASFYLISSRIGPPQNLAAMIDIWIRATGSCAFLMLTLILAIGPLARINSGFLPLLYNRRHFGVLTFLVALTHAWLMVQWFIAVNALPSLVTEMTNWENYGKFIGFPFKALGLGALLILFLMAATSHDYWLAFLGPSLWKRLHMALYVAYGLVVMHVALGIMQDDRNPAIPLMLIAGFVVVATLHIIAGWRERKNDAGTEPDDDGWIRVGPLLSIPDKAALIVTPRRGERIAVFRDGDKIGAVTNLCAHQNGPIGEGRIIDGCVTCPWHGYQYRLADGCAPAPFTEKLVTYRVRIRDGLVEVNCRPLPPGTPAAIICKQART